MAAPLSPPLPSVRARTRTNRQDLTSMSRFTASECFHRRCVETQEAANSQVRQPPSLGLMVDPRPAGLEVTGDVARVPERFIRFGVVDHWSSFGFFGLSRSKRHVVVATGLAFPRRWRNIR